MQLPFYWSNAVNDAYRQYKILYLQIIFFYKYFTNMTRGVRLLFSEIYGRELRLTNLTTQQQDSHTYMTSH